ncbi:S-adenosyl-L-methionine-dependent methyltransferase superfamily protein [Abeliophyllum distichum]|uniref:S-adenosyl-L-methionine-dependent methyltransferase superfamily protein n=1 Tax=Abeliophyllum distichum TaxID=126358 RepID=A0ABD1VQP9_9LAMI
MKLAVAQSFFYIQPVLPNLHQTAVRCPPPPIATSRRRSLSLKIHLSPKSHQTHTHTPNPQTTTTTTTTQYEDDDGIPIEHVKTLVKFKSRYNYIRVLEVSRRADHTLAGSRLLLLDAPGNIHSISYLFKSITNTYFDVFATLPPLLPPGPLGILGFGAGSAAKLILETYSQIIIHGWELDQSVISVAREYFGLAKMEAQYPDRLFIHIGNALNASIRDGFSGILIDLFSKGVVIP